MVGDVAVHGAARVPRGPARLAPTRRWPRPTRKSVPFSGLLLFTFVLFAAPQHLVPALEPFMLAKLAVALALVPYLVNRAMTGRPLTIMMPTVRWALVLGIIAILSIPAGFWPAGSVDVFLDLFGKSLIVFVLVANVVDTERRFRALVVTMIGCGVFAAAHALVNYATGRFDPTGTRVAGYESALAGNPNDLALTLNIMLGLAIGLSSVLRRPLHRGLLLAAMAVMVAGIVVTFSRSGFVTLAVVGALWAWRALRERGGRVLPAIAIAVLTVMIAVPAGYSDRLSTIVETDKDPTGSAEARWQGMMVALAQMAERPVLGHGLGNSIHVIVARGGPPSEAHNAYLKLGAELGVAALIVFVLFVWSAFSAARSVRRFFSRRREGWELGRLAGGVEIAIVAFAVGALFSPVPYHFYVYFPTGLAVAIFAIAARVPPSAPGRSR